MTVADPQRHRPVDVARPWRLPAVREPLWQPFTTRRPMPAAALPPLHEALSKLLELATVLRLAGLFLDLLRELLSLGALGEVLGPLKQ